MNRNTPPDDFDPFDDLIAEELDTSDRLSASPAAVDRNRSDRGEVEPRPNRAPFGRRGAAKNAPKPKPERRAARAAQDDDDDDLSLLDAIDDSDDLMAEIERKPRGADVGGVDVGALIGGLLQVVISAILIAAIMLLIGAGAVIGARAAGVIPGGAIDLAALARGVGGSSVVPTQPAPLPLAAALVPTTDAPTTAAVAALPTGQPTAIVPPTATPIPDCRPADLAAWWALQADNYADFTAVTPETIAAEDNPGALIQQLIFKQGYSSEVTVPNLPVPCYEDARASLLGLMDHTIERVRVLSAAGGVDPSALAFVEANLNDATAAMTGTLWQVGALVEADSPVALNVARGSGEGCGAATWYGQIEPIRVQFAGYADQIDVVALPATSVRELITNMQAVAGNADALTAPACASVPNQLRAAVMIDAIAAYTSLLSGQTANANQAFDRAASAEARYRAWAAWLAG